MTHKDLYSLCHILKVRRNRSARPLASSTLRLQDAKRTHRAIYSYTSHGNSCLKPPSNAALMLLQCYGITMPSTTDASAFPDPAPKADTTHLCAFNPCIIQPHLLFPRRCDPLPGPRVSYCRTYSFSCFDSVKMSLGRHTIDGVHRFSFDRRQWDVDYCIRCLVLVIVSFA